MNASAVVVHLWSFDGYGIYKKLRIILMVYSLVAARDYWDKMNYIVKIWCIGVLVLCMVYVKQQVLIWYDMMEYINVRPKADE